MLTQVGQDVDVYRLRARFVAQGVWVRPFKDIVYLMPSFVISDGEFRALMAAVEGIVSSVR
jgi:adenosylmethionine---8-amino-7-oxononanoate aminotransferase